MTATMHLVSWWAILFCILPFIDAEAFRVKTVTADSMQCGSTHMVGDDDAYRILMPENQTCPSSGFSCSIRFTRPIAPDHQKMNFENICVDYSRIRLEGRNTSLNISVGTSSWNFVMLTSLRYPLRRTYMDTIRCFPHNKRTVTLTFTSDCDVHGNLLRDYFASWIYVYTQSSKKHLVYYLDGTCKMKEIIDSSISSEFQLTIRSIYWQDTAWEPQVQTCSLKLQTYTYYVIEERARLCTTWNFPQVSCEVTVMAANTRFSIDYNTSRNYSCSMGKTSSMDACMPFGVLDNPFFKVTRNESRADDRVLSDGVPLFEVEGVLKAQKKKKYVYRGSNSDVYGGSNSDVYGGSNSNFDSTNSSYEEDDGSLPLKVFFPVAFLVGLCSCVCGISRKKAKSRQQESSANGDAYNMASNLRAEHDGYAGGRTPQTRPLYTPEPEPRPRPWAGSSGGDQANRMAASPPAYGDLDHTASHSRSREGQAFGATYPTSIALPPPMSTEEASIEPPPLVCDGASGAPPAYHELFPDYNQ